MILEIDDLVGGYSRVPVLKRSPLKLKRANWSV